MTAKLAAAEIYEIKDRKTGKLYVAKAESLGARYPKLSLEYQCYQALQSSKQFIGVTEYVQHHNYNIILMDKLGLSLDQLFISNGNKFSVRCVAAIAIQILSRIEELHKHNYLHRCIKQNHFLIPNLPKHKLMDKKSEKIYMIDMAFAKKWNEDGRHIPHKTGKRLIGVPRYVSIYTHFGEEQSRRDDLESLGYLLMHFLRGNLPWQGLRGKTREEKYQKIGFKKRDTTLDELCNGYPTEFKEYLAAVKDLTFEEDPPYEAYRALFQGVLDDIAKHKISPYDFDWQTRLWNTQRIVKQYQYDMYHNYSIPYGVLTLITKFVEYGPELCLPIKIEDC